MTFARPVVTVRKEENIKDQTKASLQAIVDPFASPCLRDCCVWVHFAKAGPCSAPGFLNNRKK